MFSGLAVSLIPSSAFANYYSYEGCLNNGGGYFGYLGELADTMIMSPDAQKDYGSLLERETYEQKFILEAVKSSERVCAKQEKRPEQGQCYLDTIKIAKKELRANDVKKPKGSMRREAIKAQRLPGKE